MRPRLKVVVFDWNGTLLHDTYAVLAAFNAAFIRHAFRQVEMEEFQRCYDPPYERFFENLRMPKEMIPLVKKDIVQTFHDIYEPLSRQSPMRVGSDDVLEDLAKRGIKPVILSNHLVPSISSHLKRLGLSAFFGASDVLANNCVEDQLKGIQKGSRLENYLTLQGIKPEEVAIVGDTPEEIVIQKKYDLGMSVAITGGCASEDRLRAADHIIHEQPELPCALFGLSNRANAFLARP